MGYGKVEENEAVRMSYCELGVWGRWVGSNSSAFEPAFSPPSSRVGGSSIYLSLLFLVRVG